jgi:hypothetical protein
MRLPKLPLEGRCRCGRLEIRVTKAPICTAACHCRGCQKMSSSAYSLTAMVPADGFEVTSGEPAIGGMHGDDIHHYFCPHCMTWMFSRPVGFDFVNLRPTMLDDANWFRPFMETCTTTRLDFAETGAVRSFEEFPAMEDYEGILREYRDWAGIEG